MLRRRLLTAAIAAPGLMLGGRAAAYCTPIIQGGRPGEMAAGSSVAPLGRVSSKGGKAGGARAQSGTDCGGGYYFEGPAQWPTESIRRQVEYQYNVAIGALPNPGYMEVPNADTALAVIQASQEQREELSYITNVLEAGTIAGSLGGAYVGGMGGLGYGIAAYQAAGQLAQLATIGSWGLRGFLAGGAVGFFLGGGAAVIYLIVTHNATVAVTADSTTGSSMMASMDGQAVPVYAYGSPSTPLPSGHTGAIGGFKMYGHTSGGGGGSRYVVIPNTLL